jgi:AcrR family transcriptional regulator
MEATTSERIISAASKLFYSEGLGRVSVDAVAAAAGVTKRTLYYHFRSKDDLIAAYLHRRDQPNLTLFEHWFEATDGGPADRVRGIFLNLARSARHSKWKGCGFLRTAAELAAMPGHPAIKVGAAHKKKVELWLRTVFEAEGLEDGLPLARQVVLLMDGAFAVTLLHRDPSYIETAGDAAYALIQVALPGLPSGRKRGPVTKRSSARSLLARQDPLSPDHASRPTDQKRRQPTVRARHASEMLITDTG